MGKAGRVPKWQWRENIALPPGHTSLLKERLFHTAKSCDTGARIVQEGRDKCNLPCYSSPLEIGAWD